MSTLNLTHKRLTSLFTHQYREENMIVSCFIAMKLYELYGEE